MSSEIGIVGETAGIGGIGVDGGFVFDAGFQKIQFEFDLAGGLVGDAADVPDIVRVHLRAPCCLR